MTRRVVVIAGPNGARKTTASRRLLQGALRVDEFVNADAIAEGLSGFRPESAALQAGRVMLERLKYLAKNSASFAFETKLATRSFAPWLRRLRNEEGYHVNLAFLWVPSPEFAIRRVAQRVRGGGHYVEDLVVRRRYVFGLKNFFNLYQPVATSWRMYNNSLRGGPRLVARGRGGTISAIQDQAVWDRIVKEFCK